MLTSDFIQKTPKHFVMKRLDVLYLLINVKQADFSSFLGEVCPQ